MITVVVQFKLPDDTRAEEANARYRTTAPRFQSIPGLIRKYYLFDEESGKGGGCYLFETRAAAEATFGQEWRKRISAMYGEPDVQYFDTPFIVDNLSGEIVENG